MKALVCEMCSSNDLLKQDGMYVCQNCGTKYTSDEAKKMMVEVDNTKKLERLYERARKSREVGDLKHASEYYKEILDEVPNDWEAYFYFYLGEHTTYTLAEAGAVAAKLGNTIPAAYDMAIADCTPEEATSRVAIITANVATVLARIGTAAMNWLDEGTKRQLECSHPNMSLHQAMQSKTMNVILHVVAALDAIDKKVEEVLSSNVGIDRESVNKPLLLLREIKYSCANSTNTIQTTPKKQYIKPELIHEYAEKVHELNPDFKVPSIESATIKGGGCYIATAVYGSYDCPQVWTLRRYRDEQLLPTSLGRVFVQAYYATSPTLVKLFGDSTAFKRICRRLLDPFVAKLIAQGFEATPYKDS